MYVVLSSKLFAIKNIQIINTNYLITEEIEDNLELQIGDNIFKSYFTKLTYLEKHPLVEKYEISLDLSFNLILDITEYKPLMYNECYYLNNNDCVNLDQTFAVPAYFETEAFEERDVFLKNLALLNSNANAVYRRIRSIEYSPSKLSTKRVIFRMEDGFNVIAEYDAFVEDMSDYFYIIDTVYNKLGETKGTINLIGPLEFFPTN